MFSTLLTRNLKYVARHPVRTWAVRRACKEHVKKFPYCAWCGSRKKLHAHHVIPLWEDESLGAEPTNFITLCGKRCHITVGHNGSYATKYVRNVKQICSERTVSRREGS